ncbi:MAG: cellulose binding domain-containing protein, partial [Actinoplanes sp.]
IDGDTLYVAALRGQRLWSVPLTTAGGAGTPVARLQGQYGRLRTVERAPDGSLWVTTSNRDGRGTPAATDDRVIRFPAAGGPTTPPPSSPVTTPPVTTPPATTPPPTTPAAACSVRWQANQWSNGFTAEIALTNLGAARTAWTVTFSFAGDQRITNAWNATDSQAAAQVTARNAGWNGTLAAGATTTFGVQGTYSGTNARPTDFRLDGTPCAITN